MSDPIHSSSWTGPPESQVAPYRRQFTYEAGQSGVTTDYHRLVEAQRAGDAAAAAIPRSVRGVIRLAALLLFLGPAALLLAWAVVDLVIPDQPLQDYAGLLLALGTAPVAVALSQMISRSEWLVFVRKMLLVIVLLGTVAAAALFAYSVIRSHADAVASEPQRVFAIGDDYQREDGTLLAGGRQTPLPHGYCVRVQLLRGDYGLRWLRVIERPQDVGHLYWPIRREDCFGSKPISSLRV